MSGYGVWIRLMICSEETEQQQGQKLGDLSDMLGRREAKRALPLKA